MHMNKTKELKDSMEAIIVINFDLEYFDESEISVGYVRSSIEKCFTIPRVDIQILDLEKNTHLF